MTPYPPWGPITPPNSCTDCWMLFAGDGYCRYERELTKVECDCARTKKGVASSSGGIATELGGRGQRLEDGRWIRCRDCEGKTYLHVNRVTYQCPGAIVGGKVRKHRKIHLWFWADERESMSSIKFQAFR